MKDAEADWRFPTCVCLFPCGLFAVTRSRRCTTINANIHSTEMWKFIDKLKMHRRHRRCEQCAPISAI